MQRIYDWDQLGFELVAKLIETVARTKEKTEKTKTYNRRDSQMVTHSSTSRPVQCLCMAERTGCPVLTDLWSYVSFWVFCNNISLSVGAKSGGGWRLRGDTDGAAGAGSGAHEARFPYSSTVVWEHKIREWALLSRALRDRT
jgi:hypothetical protein